MLNLILRIFMKRTLLLLLLLLLLPTTLAQAQTAAALQSLEVELWPDYDQAAVLVLLTGTLPPNTPLPATLTLPLPEGAEFNVAAYYTQDNILTDDGIAPLVSANQVTFTVPNGRFRVEYYQPYTASNTQRSFTFAWQSDIAVEAMAVTLQQPFTATGVTIIPAPTTVSERQDGLTYHVLPSQAVAAGEPYTVEISYTMSTPALTVSFLSDSNPNETLPILEATPVEETGLDWPVLLIVLGVLILVVTAVWYFVSNQPSRSQRPARPKPVRKTAGSPTLAKTKANFCHHCGQPLQAEDKFCRECGTVVKQR
jgi:hypothetical protein